MDWNIYDLAEIQREYPAKGHRGIEHVDIALKIENRLKIFIEVKFVTSKLEKNMVKRCIKKICR